MDELYICDSYSISITLEDVIEKLSLSDPDIIGSVARIYEKMRAVARIKSIYRVCYVDYIRDDAVSIEGVEFKSAVLADNLKDLHKVFAYVITCGGEVDDLCLVDDPIESIWLDMIKEMLLRDVQTQFTQSIKETYGIEKLSSMNPGSGDVDTWPLQQQVLLFGLLGDVYESIGVRMTDSLLMVPNKSISGFMFPSERGVINCAVCRRKDCVGRLAPYDPAFMAH